MRIAIDVEQLFYRAPGGTGRYTARLVASMAAQFSGDVVVPFCAWHGRDRMRLALARYDLGLEAVPPGRHGSGRRASATTPGEPATAAQLVRLPAPRVALLQGWHTARLGAGLARRLLGPATWSAELRRADLFHNPFPAAPPVPAPLVVTVHDAGPALHPGTYTRRGLRYHEKALDGVAQRAARVITGSQAAKAEIVANSAVPLERVRVVANGVDHRLATQDEVAGALRRHDLEGAPYVLWVGSLEPRKNVATLVRAFARLAAGRQVPHRLVLVGPLGWLHDELVPQEPARQLGDRLRTLGAVSDRDLRALYAGASLFAFPSLHEGFGMPVLEAMAQRTPVVCSDIAALAEVSGGSAVLVPPCDVEAWASALGELASDEAGRVTLGAAGFDWAAQFTWERMAQQTYAIYQEVAGTSHE